MTEDFPVGGPNTSPLPPNAEQSYVQSLLSTDHMFIKRISSILKDEGFSNVGEDAYSQAFKYVADVASQPGLAESYHSALLADPPVESPGASGLVITDAVLLSAVTAVMEQVTEGATAQTPKRGK